MRKQTPAAVVDRVAHYLYTPTILGQHTVRQQRRPRIRLIPGWVLQLVCDWYDRSLGLTDEEIKQGR